LMLKRMYIERTVMFSCYINVQYLLSFFLALIIFFALIKNLN
jgi:hypothetical protein